MISIVLPTITGREDELARTIETYDRLTPCKIEWLIEYDHPTCSSAWNAGAERATRGILHLGNDDLEPETNAWYAAGATTISFDRCIPVGWVREGANGFNGTFGRDFPRVMMCLRSWWTPLPPELHYYADNLFGDRMAAAGHPVKVSPGFDFFHRRSDVGRLDNAQQLLRDRRAYEAAR